jgi:hypothetical protein
LYSQLLFNSSTFLMAISTSCCIFIDLWKINKWWLEWAEHKHTAILYQYLNIH